MTTLVNDGIWTWFTDPRVIYNAGVYYFGYVAVDGSVKVSKYSAGTVTSFTLHATLEVDDHDNAAPIVLPNGKIACFYSTHNDGSGTRYRISSNAGDISAFAAEQTLGAGQTLSPSYSNPFYVSAASKIALFYRSGTPGADAALGLRTAATDLSSWGTEIRICNGFSDAAQPYWKFAQNGTDRIDVICTDRHPANDAGASSVYHFYLQWDSGTSAFKYYKTDGTEITAVKPWRINLEATQVYDGTSEEAWIWDIRIDAAGKPRALITRFPTTTDHRYYFTRWNGTAWTAAVQIATAGTRLYAGEVNYSGGGCFDGNDTNIVYLSRESGGIWEIQEWRTTDNGATWAKRTDITTGSTMVNARPYSPNGHDGDLAAVWWNANYTSFTSWS